MTTADEPEPEPDAAGEPDDDPDEPQAVTTARTTEHSMASTALRALGPTVPTMGVLASDGTGSPEPAPDREAWCDGPSPNSPGRRRPPVTGVPSRCVASTLP